MLDFDDGKYPDEKNIPESELESIQLQGMKVPLRISNGKPVKPGKFLQLVLNNDALQRALGVKLIVDGAKPEFYEIPYDLKLVPHIQTARRLANNTKENLLGSTRNKFYPMGLQPSIGAEKRYRIGNIVDDDLERKQQQIDAVGTKIIPRVTTDNFDLNGSKDGGFHGTITHQFGKFREDRQLVNFATLSSTPIKLTKYPDLPKLPDQPPQKVDFKYNLQFKKTTPELPIAMQVVYDMVKQHFYIPSERMPKRRPGRTNPVPETSMIRTVKTLCIQKQIKKADILTARILPTHGAKTAKIWMDEFVKHLKKPAVLRAGLAGSVIDSEGSFSPGAVFGDWGWVRSLIDELLTRPAEEQDAVIIIAGNWHFLCAV